MLSLDLPSFSLNMCVAAAAQVLQMDASDQAACVICLESAVATLSAALHRVQSSFDSLQASCFADVSLLSKPHWAEQMLDTWSDTCDIHRLLAVAAQIHDKVNVLTSASVYVCMTSCISVFVSAEWQPTL